jgi:hypothetical protein
MIFKFLSIWVWILVILHSYTSDVFNLIFLTLFVLTGGAYISFVHPRYYSFSFGCITIKTDALWKRLTIEIIFHFLLLMYVMIIYQNKYALFSYQTLNSVLLLIVYFIIINVRKMYHLQNNDILMICMIFIVILLISSKLI